MQEERATFVVVGGGIAGVSCLETLAFLHPDEPIILLSESSLIKTVTNLQAITRTISNFDVEEAEGNSFVAQHPNVKIITDSLQELLSLQQKLVTSSGTTIHYKYLCLCLGAKPKLIPQSLDFPQHIIGIRDTDSVENFIKKLKNCKTILLVGNGGIASEIAFKIQNVQLHWIIKDSHISSTFIDAGIAEFFQDTLKQDHFEDKTPIKRLKYTENKAGAALGPDWYQNFLLKGAGTSKKTIHYNTEITDVKKHNELAIIATLSNSQQIPCDLIISATGVTTKITFKSDKNLQEEPNNCGFLVNELMETNLPNIFAAGDCCHASWPLAKHWLQMKLWTQARQMGCFAAKAMSSRLQNTPILLDFAFELFGHSTKLFNYKVILLGLYNGQKLDGKYEMLIRMTKNTEYVKFVLENGKLQGAILVGETDLEEMCENLILNQLDLTPFGDDILNPNIDIEDYFD